MVESKEPTFEGEPTKEDIERFIVDRIQLLWSYFGWQCKIEPAFTEEPIKQGGYALVQQRPKDVSDSNERFKVLFFVGKNSADRAEILKTLDFIITHEVAHVITGMHSHMYSLPLTREQLNDFNQSKRVKPELFYSGAHEIATDMVGLRIAEHIGRQQEFASSFLSTVVREVSREQGGEVEPFLSDQARFAVFADVLQQMNLLPDHESAQLQTNLEFWRSSREELDEADKARFSELVKYFREVADRASRIEVS